MLTIDSVKNAFESAGEKYSTKKGKLVAMLLQLANENVGLFRGYSASDLAENLGEFVPDAEKSDVSAAVSEAKNIIRDAVFRRLWKESFGTIAPFKNTERGCIVEAIEKEVSEYNLLKKGKKTAISLLPRLMTATNADQHAIETFCEETQKAIGQHMETRSAREEREEIELEDFSF